MKPNFPKLSKLSTLRSPFSSPLGFTLIEIIIVITLIGVLATWMVSLINPPLQFKKGRDAERKADVRQIQAALEIYRANKDSYPDNLPSCGSEWTDGGITYMRKIPCDPTTNEDYFYKFEDPNYTLVTCLENVNDKQQDEEVDPQCEGGDTNRSYTVVNP